MRGPAADPPRSGQHVPGAQHQRGDADGPGQRGRPPDVVGRRSPSELGIRAGPARRLSEVDVWWIEPHVEGRQRLYSETDIEIAVACDTLARYGIAPRHLRAFRTAADREAALIEALVAPALRSRNVDRRRAGMEDLQQLAETAQELSQLLFARNVRRLADA